MSKNYLNNTRVRLKITHIPCFLNTQYCDFFPQTILFKKNFVIYINKNTLITGF